MEGIWSENLIQILHCSCRMSVTVQALTWAEGESWCSARASTLAVTPVPQEVTIGFAGSTPAPLNTSASCSGPRSFPSWSTCRASNPPELHFKRYPYHTSPRQLDDPVILKGFCHEQPHIHRWAEHFTWSFSLAGQPLRACLAAMWQQMPS